MAKIGRPPGPMSFIELKSRYGIQRAKQILEERKAKEEQHRCYFNGKKHCRICGERELTVWLQNELFEKECTPYDAE